MSLEGSRIKYSGKINVFIGEKKCYIICSNAGSKYVCISFRTILVLTTHYAYSLHHNADGRQYTPVCTRKKKMQSQFFSN